MSYLNSTMLALEANLTVGTIASTPIVSCDDNDDADRVLAREDWLDFDVIPVQSGGRVVAVVERSTGRRRPLDSSLIVSNSHPLEDFLISLGDGLTEDGYRLVLFNSRISGIVTPSDLLRLPVRVLTFALVSHLEATMTQLIEAYAPNPQDWFVHLNDEVRVEELVARQTKLNHDRMNPSLLELTYFSDKINILGRLKALSNGECERAGGLNELRNQIAHNHDFVSDRQDLLAFLRRLRRIRPFIIELERRAESRVSTSTA